MSDIRDTPFHAWYISINHQRMTAVVFVDREDDNGELVATEKEVSFHYEVCSVCNGRGQFVNPNIDRNGISDMDEWDDEERDDYFSGGYDVVCGYCGGKAVEPVPNDTEVLKNHQEFQNEMAEWEAERNAEIAFGA